ncbi:MAG: response regulator [Daejeonella sp.]|uniref:response regulator n=1 Tax=Daejeonella sp. TaxID=2805397 RepID=UPI002736A414|nr:response regulator [Daejeonella sp.]MDP3468968.1 response regulator [Daejeonella sp.]
MISFKYKSVLLVDDSYIDNLINRKILDNSDFAESITVIESPKEAFNYIRDLYLEGKELPEVIFLDLRMPIMNGFEFLKALMELPDLGPDKVKIYVLTSSLDPKDIRRVKENHLVSKFIGKPLTSQILQEL